MIFFIKGILCIDIIRGGIMKKKILIGVGVLILLLAGAWYAYVNLAPKFFLLRDLQEMASVVDQISVTIKELQIAKEEKDFVKLGRLSVDLAKLGKRVRELTKKLKTHGELYFQRVEEQNSTKQ